MVYRTGDLHGECLRFNTSAFPDQRNMRKKDIVIVCGDFGLIWRQSSGADERYWLDWLNDKPFTTLFVDGNHENFTRLNSDEFPTVDLFKGKAQQIRPSIYRLLRGQIYEIEGKTFFAFGGASSHDCEDGILDPEAFPSDKAFEAEYHRWRTERRRFRVKGVSWWPEEMPSEEEMESGIKALESVNYEVDYVITHCLPQDAVSVLSNCTFYPDRLTMYFNDLLHRGLRFQEWICGHYHCDQRVMGKFRVLYQDIERFL